jgi:DNA-binding NtrC family response regulator
MEPLNLVIYQKDPGTGQALASNLAQHFGRVSLVRQREEIHSAISQHHVDVLVLDLETSRGDEVERLHHEFPSLSIVATHRLADDDLWTEVMNQGASDVCEPRNDEVLRSVLRGKAHRAAAA